MERDRETCEIERWERSFIFYKQYKMFRFKKKNSILILATASYYYLIASIAITAILPVFGLDDDDEFVTCGSAIKLSHYESKVQTKQEHFLSSEGKNLGSGSGQQIVTSVANPTTTNTLWWVRGPDNEDRPGEVSACTGPGSKPGDKISCGSLLRLTHLNSMKNLHSHDVKSPLSRQQEVSAFGVGDGKGDAGDDWKLICNTGYWKREAMVQFQHVDSKRYLGASSTVKFTHQNCGHHCPILNHLEAFARNNKDNYGNWFVEMGVHLSQ